MRDPAEFGNVVKGPFMKRGTGFASPGDTDTALRPGVTGG